MAFRLISTVTLAHVFNAHGVKVLQAGQGSDKVPTVAATCGLRDLVPSFLRPKKGTVMNKVEYVDKKKQFSVQAVWTENFFGGHYVYNIVLEGDQTPWVLRHRTATGRTSTIKLHFPNLGSNQNWKSFSAKTRSWFRPELENVSQYERATKRTKAIGDFLAGLQYYQRAQFLVCAGATNVQFQNGLTEYAGLTLSEIEPNFKKQMVYTAKKTKVHFAESDLWNQLRKKLSKSLLKIGKLHDDYNYTNALGHVLDVFNAIHEFSNDVGKRQKDAMSEVPTSRLDAEPDSIYGVVMYAMIHASASPSKKSKIWYSLMLLQPFAVTMSPDPSEDDTNRKIALANIISAATVISNQMLLNNGNEVT